MFIYDGANLIGEVDATNALIAKYTHGLSCLVRMVRGGRVERSYHFDGLGSTRQLVDDSQLTTERYVYDAWGNARNATRKKQNAPQYDVGGLGYYSDSDSGMMLLGVRYYDNGVGRFWSVDPARDGGNWYVYADNSPTNLTDPSGLQACPGTTITCQWFNNCIFQILSMSGRWAVDGTCTGPFGRGQLVRFTGRVVILVCRCRRCWCTGNPNTSGWITNWDLSNCRQKVITQNTTICWPLYALPRDRYPFPNRPGMLPPPRRILPPPPPRPKGQAYDPSPPDGGIVS